ncbi:MAG TPA: DUF488 domain-containing protein [Azospira sp.]|nr:DUF488 domain-containing protein [Azospira sp.]
MSILLKRAYELPEPADGLRILVDRLWPRGVAKESARIDLWLKEVAPSTALRQWFGHDPLKWREFRERYFLELGQHPEAVEELAQHTRHGVVTLVYGAKDKAHSHALALKDYLQDLERSA